MNGWPGGWESRSCSWSRSLSCLCSRSCNELVLGSWVIMGSQWRPGTRSLKMMVPGVSMSWSEGYKPEYVPYVAKGVRGLHVITSKEETACRRQSGLRCGCQVHAVSSVGGGGSGQKIFVLCQHTLGSCCVLTLLTNADLKTDITLFLSSTHNPLSSFHTLDKGLCLTCNNNNKFTQKSKFKLRLVLESLELSNTSSPVQEASHDHGHSHM